MVMSSNVYTSQSHRLMIHIGAHTSKKIKLGAFKSLEVQARQSSNCHLRRPSQPTATDKPRLHPSIPRTHLMSVFQETRSVNALHQGYLQYFRSSDGALLTAD